MPRGIVAQSEPAALDQAKRHVFERRAVVLKQAVLESAFVQGQGEVDLGRGSVPAGDPGVGTEGTRAFDGYSFEAGTGDPAGGARGQAFDGGF